MFWILLAVFAPYIVVGTLLIAVGFYGLPGILVYLAVFGLLSYRAAGWVDRHSQWARYDSKLTDERIQVATEEYIRGVIERRNK